MTNYSVICVLIEKNHFSEDWAAVWNNSCFRISFSVKMEKKKPHSTMSEKSREESACGDGGKADMLSGA